MKIINEAHRNENDRKYFTINGHRNNQRNRRNQCNNNDGTIFYEMSSDNVDINFDILATGSPQSRNQSSTTLRRNRGVDLTTVTIENRSRPHFENRNQHLHRRHQKNTAAGVMLAIMYIMWPINNL